MKLFLPFFFLLVSFAAHSQNYAFRHPALYAEIYGNSLNSATVNFEKVLTIRNKIKWGIRIGAGGLLPRSNTVVFPVNFFGFTGYRKSHLEFGAGLSYCHATFDVTNSNGEVIDYNSSIYAPFHFGYRFQKPEGGVFFRLGFSTSVRLLEFSSYEPGSIIFPVIGLALGYAFQP